MWDQFLRVYVWYLHGCHLLSEVGGVYVSYPPHPVVFEAIRTMVVMAQGPLVVCFCHALCVLFNTKVVEKSPQLAMCREKKLETHLCKLRVTL